MKRFLYCLLLIVCSVSCDKKYISNIPNGFPVHIELDLTFEDKDLYGYPTHKIFKREDINATRILCVGYGGVIVFHGLGNDSMGAFYAFDLACPYEGRRDVHLEIEDNIYAVCPKCNSRFDISFGIGHSISGPANEEKFSMKSYYVTQVGNKVSVIHR